MKSIIVLALLAVAAAQEYYTTVDDHLDVAAFFADVPRTKQFLDCYMDLGPCPEAAANYKSIMAEAVMQSCRKCSPDLKHIFWQFLQGLKESYPDNYKSLREKYDAENKFFDALEAEISKY